MRQSFTPTQNTWQNYGFQTSDEGTKGSELNVYIHLKLIPEQLLIFQTLNETWGFRIRELQGLFYAQESEDTRSIS